MEVQINPNFTYSIYFEGDQYLQINFFFILNDEDSFAKLCNEFHNETPLIVIENCFLLVLDNISKILFLLNVIFIY